jgi:hypothetical protein
MIEMRVLRLGLADTDVQVIHDTGSAENVGWEVSVGLYRDSATELAVEIADYTD